MLDSSRLMPREAGAVNFSRHTRPTVNKTISYAFTSVSRTLYPLETHVPARETESLVIMGSELYAVCLSVQKDHAKLKACWGDEESNSELFLDIIAAIKLKPYWIQSNKIKAWTVRVFKGCLDYSLCLGLYSY